MDPDNNNLDVVIDVNAVRHSDELTTLRRTNPSLRNEEYWTGDFALYIVENHVPILYLARAKDSPFLKELGKAINRFRKKKNYIPDQESIENIINSEDTVRIDLSTLDLIGDSPEFGILEIKTSDYETYLSNNPETKLLAERVYDRGDEFKENMKKLSEQGVEKVCISVLKPSYVIEQCKEVQAFGRACVLHPIRPYSSFHATRKSIPSVKKYLEKLAISSDIESDYLEKYRKAIQVLLSNPEAVIQVMTPNIKGGFSTLIHLYENR